MTEHEIGDDTHSDEDIGQLQGLVDSAKAVAAHVAEQERLAMRPTLSHCIECGEEIPEGRRKAIKGVQTCIFCQELSER